MFKELDHIAIVVKDTEEALQFYRDRLGLKVLVSEELKDGGVRLTHLDMGNVQLQLVEPLTAEHPLQAHLASKGEGLHHLCWKVDSVSKAMEQLPEHGLQPKPNEPHSGVEGRSAAFIAPEGTRGVLWELTGEQ